MKGDKNGKLTQAQKHEMAEAIIDYLTKRGLFVMCAIYTGSEKYADDQYTEACEEAVEQKTAKGSRYFLSEYEGCPCEYNNPDTLTMTFEGPLYHDLNHRDWDKGAWAGLNKIAARYGLMHEMGYAWSLAFYPL